MTDFPDYTLCDCCWDDILQEPPVGGNAWIILAQQWIAAKLNEANGASVPTQVATALQQAAILLEANCKSIDPWHPQRKQALKLKQLLEKYNSGVIGPGACTESSSGSSSCSVPWWWLPFSPQHGCGHGWYSHGRRRCMCWPGWSGNSCDSCASPSQRDRSYICLPTYQSWKPYQLWRVRSSHLSYYLSVREGVLPGSMGRDGALYDCRCRRGQSKRSDDSDGSTEALQHLNDFDYDEASLFIYMESEEQQDEAVLDELDFIAEGLKELMNEHQTRSLLEQQHSCTPNVNRPRCEHGWLLFGDSVCRCEPGWSGRHCDSCGPPLAAASRRLYLCEPQKLGGRSYRLRSVSRRYQSLYLQKSWKKPGEAGLDCRCRYTAGKRDLSVPDMEDSLLERYSYMDSMYDYTDNKIYGKHKQPRYIGSSKKPSKRDTSENGGGGFMALLIVAAVLLLLIVLTLAIAFIWWCCISVVVPKRSYRTIQRNRHVGQSLNSWNY